MADLLVPVETQELFAKYADEAVAALRQAVETHGFSGGVFSEKMRILTASYAPTFKGIAQEEFDRIGREYVRRVVAEAFDRIWDQKGL